MTRICVIPGDGIGTEVIPAAVEVLRATGLAFEFVAGEAGWACFERHGTSLTDETLEVARAADAVLFGAVASPSHAVPGYRSPIVRLRRELDLYANMRPTSNAGLALKSIQPPTSNLQHPIDLVVVRENTEDLYAGRERVEDGGDTAIAERVITRRASERIARAAFELARARAGVRGQRSGMNTPGSDPRSPVPDHRPRVTIVHKANVLRETCGLFRMVALGIAAEYPDTQVDELLVDNAALQLVLRPERFDVIVTTNMFGDILSDVACAWGGGLGLATSANIGDRYALFEPVHGAAPDIAGKGIANPLAAIGCAAMLLEHLAGNVAANLVFAQGIPVGANPVLVRQQYAAWAGRVQAAVRRVMAEGPHTPDLGGTARTIDVARAIIAVLSEAI